MAVPRRILCNWFPNWPIQRLVVARPELRGRRVVLFGRDPRRGQLVSAVSPRAMRDGLAVGMPLSEARSLLRRTSAEEVVEAGEEPGFFVFPHDHRADRQAWESLCDQLDGFSPLVGGELETTDPKPKRGNREASPDSILLDITGLGPLFGGERSLVDRQMEQIERLGYLSRVAVAGTVGAAWALARCFSGTWFRQHGGPLVVPPEDTTWLQRLPITALRLDPALVDTLGQLGIRTVAQLRQLSRDDLALRFGPVIQRRLDQLWGVLEEPLPAHRRSVDWQAEQVLEHPTRHRETMEVVLHRLLTELCERLRREQRGALEWTIRLRCRPGEPIVFPIRLFRPVSTVEEVLPLVEMQLEEALGSLTRLSRKRQVRVTSIEITEIRVTVSSHVLLALQQRKLFDDQPGLDRQALTQLINRLASRLGTDSVVYPTLQSGAQPEYSFRLQPLVDANRRRRSPTGPRPTSHRWGRPVRLFHPPLPLESAGSRSPADRSTAAVPRCLSAIQRRAVTAGNPVTPDARAENEARQMFLGRRQNWQVVASWGPERMETGWWRGRSVCRDYWRVETDTGQHFWIFHSLRSGRWWLHGAF